MGCQNSKTREAPLNVLPAAGGGMVSRTSSNASSASTAAAAGSFSPRIAKKDGCCAAPSFALNCASPIANAVTVTNYGSPVRTARRRVALSDDHDDHMTERSVPFVAAAAVEEVAVPTVTVTTVSHVAAAVVEVTTSQSTVDVSDCLALSEEKSVAEFEDASATSCCDVGADSDAVTVSLSSSSVLSFAVEETTATPVVADEEVAVLFETLPAASHIGDAASQEAQGEQQDQRPYRRVAFDKETMRLTAPRTQQLALNSKSNTAANQRAAGASATALKKRTSSSASNPAASMSSAAPNTSPSTTRLTKRQTSMVQSGHKSTGRRGPVASKYSRCKAQMQGDVYMEMANAFERLLTNVNTIDAHLDSR